MHSRHRGRIRTFIPAATVAAILAPLRSTLDDATHPGEADAQRIGERWAALVRSVDPALLCPLVDYLPSAIAAVVRAGYGAEPVVQV
jgi:hypothetical protein